MCFFISRWHCCPFATPRPPTIFFFLSHCHAPLATLHFSHFVSYLRLNMFFFGPMVKLACGLNWIPSFHLHLLTLRHMRNDIVLVAVLSLSLTLFLRLSPDHFLQCSSTVHIREGGKGREDREKKSLTRIPLFFFFFFFSCSYVRIKTPTQPR